MYTVSAWDNIYPGLECEHKLFSLSHRRNLESGLETKGKKLFRKRMRNINSSLSHRRNLESGLKRQREKYFRKKNHLCRQVKNYTGKVCGTQTLLSISSPQSGIRFEETKKEKLFRKKE
jgi:hypothetical protein